MSLITLVDYDESTGTFEAEPGDDLENPGGCVSCGYIQDGCEPDARNYECEECGQHQVFGAEELLIMGKVTLSQ